MCFLEVVFFSDERNILLNVDDILVVIVVVCGVIFIDFFKLILNEIM